MNNNTQGKILYYFLRTKALSSGILFLKEYEASFAAFCKARIYTIDPRRQLRNFFLSDRYMQRWF